jgi:hypothetical protein
MALQQRTKIPDNAISVYREAYKSYSKGVEGLVDFGKMIEQYGKENIDVPLSELRDVYHAMEHLTGAYKVLQELQGNLTAAEQRVGVVYRSVRDKVLKLDDTAYATHPLAASDDTTVTAAQQPAGDYEQLDVGRAEAGAIRVMVMHRAASGGQRLPDSVRVDLASKAKNFAKGQLPEVVALPDLERAITSGRVCAKERSEKTSYTWYNYG